MGYEKLWDIISVEKTLINSAKRRGIEQGKEEGKAEEKRLITRNFKLQGLPADVIAQCTGLSADEISAL